MAKKICGSCFNKGSRDNANGAHRSSGHSYNVGWGHSKGQRDGAANFYDRIHAGEKGYEAGWSAGRKNRR